MGAALSNVSIDEQAKYSTDWWLERVAYRCIRIARRKIGQPVFGTGGARPQAAGVVRLVRKVADRSSVFQRIAFAVQHSSLPLDGGCPDNASSVQVISSEDRLAVDVALTAMAARGNPTTLALSIACALFGAIALWPSVDHGALLTWLGVLFGVSALRYANALRHREIGPQEVRQQQIKLAYWAAVGGAIWAMPAYLFLSASMVDEHVLIFITFMVVGIAGAVPVLHSTLFSSAAAFEICSLVGVSLRLASFGDRLHYMQAAALLSFLVAMLFGAWYSHQRLHLILQSEQLRKKLLASQLRQEQEYFNLIDRLPDMVMRYDREGRRIYVNKALTQLTGMRAADLLHYKPQEKPISTPELISSCVRQVLDSGRSAVGETAYTLDDGQQVYFHIHFGPEFGPDGEVAGVLAIGRDISSQKLYEAELKIRADLEAQLSSLASNIPGFIYTAHYGLDGQVRFPYASTAIGEVLGLSLEDLLNGAAPMRERFHADDIPLHLNAVERSRRDLTPIRVDIRYQHPDKGERWMEIRSTPRREPDGTTLWHGLMIDITQRKQAEQAVAVREREFRSLAENLPDIVIRYDRHGKRTYVNPTLEKMAEHDYSELLGHTPLEKPVPGFEPAEDYWKKLKQVLSTGKSDSLQATHKRGDDSRVFQISMTPETDEAGEIVGVLTILRDITEAFSYQQHVQSLAFYDVLTGLPNRALFNERAKQFLTDAERTGEQVGLMMMDLDHFKEINDTLGHSIGDELLCEAARRLQNALRDSDLVARLGGDEFVLVLPHIHDGDDLGKLAASLLQILKAPYVLEDKEFFVTASIGIALYPANGCDIGTLLKHADSALYLAKGQGRNNFQFYSPALTEHARERLALEIDLRRSLAQGELSVHYQPKVHLESGQVTGAEALLRWNHPQRGIVPPDRFIGIAEETGLIVEIGMWVLRSACEMAVRWNRHARELRRIAINLSPRQFHRHDLQHTILGILAETGCQPEWIELEITEGLLLEDREDIRDSLLALHREGISIAIDDFGTGYSALSYLNRFPISTLKIDRSFVADLPNQQRSSALVEAILALARSLDMTVVAEGVETDDQADWLSTVGCDQGQGYLWSKPLAPEAFHERFLSERNVSR